MAFKLSKDERADLADHMETLAKKKEALREAEAKRLAAIEEADAAVSAAITDYNGALSDAKTFVEEVAERLRGEYDEKSEKWQESDRAQEVNEFIEQWENVDMEDVDESETVQPDELGCEHEEALRELPEEFQG
jgi:hypothetical protein